MEFTSISHISYSYRKEEGEKIVEKKKREV